MGDKNAQSVRTEEYLDIQTHSQDLSAGGFDNTFSVSSDASDFRLISISFHGTTSWTQLITITKDSHLGANFDVVIASKNVNGTDAIFLPEKAFADYKIGDKIRVQISNNGTPSTTIYCEFKAEFI